MTLPPPLCVMGVPPSEALKSPWVKLKLFVPKSLLWNVGVQQRGCGHS